MPLYAGTKQASKPSQRSALPPPGKDTTEAILTADFARLNVLKQYWQLGAGQDSEWNTPLHVAAGACSLSVDVREKLIRLLVAEHGDISIRNTSGESAAMIAEKKCSGPTSVVALLTAGRSELLEPGPTSMPKESQAFRLKDKGYGLFNRGEYKQALETFRQAVQLHPSHDAMTMGVAITLERLGDYIEAEKEYRKALNLAPHNSVAKEALARAEQRAAMQRQTQQAQAEKDRQAQQAKAREEAFAVEARGWIQAGDQHLAAGRLSDAWMAYQRAQHLSPNNAEPFNKQGIVEFRRGDFGMAELNFKNALKRDPNNGQFSANLAAAQQAGGARDARLRQAKEDLARETQLEAHRSASSANDTQAVTDALMNIAGAIASNRAVQQHAAQQAAEQRAQLQAQQVTEQARQARERAEQMQQQQQLQQQAARAAEAHAQQARDAAQRQQQMPAAQTPRTISYQESLAAQQQRNQEAQRIAQRQSVNGATSPSNFSPSPSEPRGVALASNNCPGLPTGATNCGFAGYDTVNREKLAREKREFEERMKREEAEKRAKQDEINRKAQQDAQRNIEQATAYRNNINANNEKIRIERENYVNGQARRSDAIVATPTTGFAGCPAVHFANRTDINLAITYYYQGTVAGKASEGKLGSLTLPSNASFDDVRIEFPCDGTTTLRVYDIRWKATPDNYYKYSPI